MPQVSLYLSQATFQKVRRAAKQDRLTVSKWVSRTINNVFARSWPSDFAELYGSITDPTFQAPSRKDLPEDARRENL